MVGVDVSENMPDVQNLIDTHLDYRCISEVQYDALSGDEEKAAWLHDCHHEHWMRTIEDDEIKWGNPPLDNEGNPIISPVVGHPGWQQYSVTTYTSAGPGAPGVPITTQVYVSPEGYIRPLGQGHVSGMNYDWK